MKRYHIRVLLCEEMVGESGLPLCDVDPETGVLHSVIRPVAVGPPLFNNGLPEPKIDLKTAQWVGAEGLSFGKFDPDEIKQGELYCGLFNMMPPPRTDHCKGDDT